MKVIVLRPEGQPEVKELQGDELHDMQALVGGYIEAALTVPVKGGELVVYCNEEGLLQKLPFNCARLTDGHPLVGTLVLAKVNDEGWQTLSDLEVALGTGIFKSMRASRRASLDDSEN